MNNLINQQVAFDLLMSRARELTGITGDLGGACVGAAKLIKSLPSADKPTGEWQIRFPYDDTSKIRTCSNCNITQTVNVYDGIVRFKFCPYCGARMLGEDGKKE